MNHENDEQHPAEGHINPQDIGRIATVDEFINSVLGDGTAIPTAEQPGARPPMPTNPPTILSREEYAEQQDMQARERGESNPHFD